MNIVLMWASFGLLNAYKPIPLFGQPGESGFMAAISSTITSSSTSIGSPFVTTSCLCSRLTSAGSPRAARRGEAAERASVHHAGIAAVREG